MFGPSKLPKLIVFLIKWTAIGVGGGLAVLAAVLVLNIGNLSQLTFGSQSPWVVLYVLANSFALSGATLSVGIAVWVRSDFGGDGKARDPHSRLERWNAGESAVIRPEDEDRPLP